MFKNNTISSSFGPLILVALTLAVRTYAACRVRGAASRGVLACLPAKNRFGATVNYSFERLAVLL